MIIEQLEQFIMVVDAGSMSEAARKLFVSRSSLSSAMKSLENDLGSPIFERVTKGVVLTPFGVNAYNQAKEICGRIEHLKKSTKSRADGYLSISNLFVPSANEAFAELYMRHHDDNVELCIEEYGVAEVVNSVAEGFAELGVVTIFPSSEALLGIMLENSKLEFHEVGKRSVCAIVGPQNPLYDMDREEVSLAELENFPRAEHYSSATHHTMGYDFAYQSIGIRSDIKVGDLGLARYIVANTDAVLVNSVSQTAFEKLYADYGCRCIRISDASMQTRYGWIKSIHRELSPIAKEYIEILMDMSEE